MGSSPKKVNGYVIKPGADLLGYLRNRRPGVHILPEAPAHCF